MNPKLTAAMLLLLSTAMLFSLGACQEECQNRHGGEDCLPVEGEDPHDDLPDPEGDFTEQELSYCTCMLFQCHDPFHDTYGVSDTEARDNCLADISARPTLGSPQITGDNQECRLHFCQESTERDCQAALGNTVCQ